MSLCLSQQACAHLLGVCRRTVRYWDRGRSRVPWSAVRLLRVLRAGELPATGWEGWRVLDGGRLVTPAGVVFCAHEFSWWALTCLQARSWQRAYDRSLSGRPSAAEGLPAAEPVIDGGALASALRPAEPLLPARSPDAQVRGLVCSGGRASASVASAAPPGVIPTKNNAHEERRNPATARAGEGSHPRLQEGLAARLATLTARRVRPLPRLAPSSNLNSSSEVPHDHST